MAFARRNFLFGVLSLPASSLLAGRTLPGLTATVYNGYELHTVLQAAGPGSSILLAPGHYGDIGSFILAGSNISVRVQSPLRTVLHAPLVVNGDFVDLEGLAFEQGVHLAGTGLSLKSNSFTGNGVTITGVSTEVANCKFSNVQGCGVAVKGTASQPRIYNNHFQDGRRGGAHNEAIQVGRSVRDSTKAIKALVENNVIERYNFDTEIMSIKSSNNVIRGNTLRDCKANLTNRQGDNNTYQGNTLERCYSIVIHGMGNRVIDNRTINPIKDRAIRIMSGNTPPNNPRQGGHSSAWNTELAGNDGTLIVGDTGYGHKLPAVGTKILSHKGRVLVKNAIGTQTNGVPITKDDDDGKGKKKSGKSASA